MMYRSVLTAALLACLLPGCRRDAGADRDHVRLVLAHPNVGIGEEVYLYAVPRHLGYFAQAGIGVDLKMASSGLQAGQIVATGGAEFGTLLAEAVLVLRELRGHLVAFDQLKTNNGFSVSVLPGSPIRSLADLEGRRVGFSVLGSGAQKLLQQQYVVDDDDVHFQAVAIGSGPAVATALRAGQVDAIVMWDAMEQILENNGLKLRHIEIPIQDQLAGYQLATTEAMAEHHAGLVQGFCRAVTKGLYFALRNPEAAVAIFYDEFPTALPAGVPRSHAVANGAKILRAYLAKALRGVPAEGPFGVEAPQRWIQTDMVYHRLNMLFGQWAPSGAYTNAFSAACNDFDHAQVALDAKQAGEHADVADP